MKAISWSISHEAYSANKEEKQADAWSSEPAHWPYSPPALSMEWLENLGLSSVFPPGSEIHPSIGKVEPLFIDFLLAYHRADVGGPLSILPYVENESNLPLQKSWFFVLY